MTASTPTATDHLVDASTLPPLRELRHRAEIPMLVLSGTATLVAIVVFISLIALNLDQPGWLTTAVFLVVDAVPRPVSSRNDDAVAPLPGTQRRHRNTGQPSGRCDRVHSMYRLPPAHPAQTLDRSERRS